MTAERALPLDLTSGASAAGPAAGPAVDPSRWWAVRPDGDLDLASAPGLTARLARVAARYPDDGIVLDLSRVPFLDCAGLRPLMGARARHGGRFCLRGASPRVLRFLTIAGVAHSLRILPGTDGWPAGAEATRCAIATDDVATHDDATHDVVGLTRRSTAMSAPAGDPPRSG